MYLYHDVIQKWIEIEETWVELVGLVETLFEVIFRMVMEEGSSGCVFKRIVAMYVHN